MHSIEKIGLYIQRGKRKDSSNDGAHETINQDDTMQVNTNLAKVHSDNLERVTNKFTEDNNLGRRSNDNPTKINNNNITPINNDNFARLNNDNLTNNNLTRISDEDQTLNSKGKALRSQKSFENEDLNWSKLTTYDGSVYPSNYAARESVGPEDDNILLKYLVVLWQRKWLVAFIALLVLAMASVVVFKLKPIYLATGTLLIESEKLDLGVEEVFDKSNTIAYYRTQEKILKSRELAGRVITELDLASKPDFKSKELFLNDETTNSADEKSGDNGFQQFFASLNTQIPEWIVKVFSDGKTDESTAKPDEMTEDDLIDIFLERLGVSLLKDSQIFEINFESGDPELAAHIVNSTMKNYIKFDDQKRLQDQTEIYQRIQNQLDEAKQQLGQAEQRLQDFREREKFIKLEEDGTSLAMKKLSSLDSDYLAADRAVKEAERVYSEAHSFSSDNISPSSPMPKIFREDQILGGLIAQQMASLEKYNEIKALYTDLHPNILTHKITVDSQNAVIDKRIKTITSQLKKDLDSALAEREAAKKALGESETGMLAINQKEFQLNSLEREVNIHRDLVQKLATRLKESSTVTDVNTQNASVLDSAIAPSDPFKPKRKKLLALAAFAALSFGLFAALVFEFFTQTVKSVKDVESRLQTPVLGFIPRVKKSFFWFRKVQAIHFFRDKPDSTFSEAFRSIRTNLLLTRVDTTRKIILVTSQSESEGKSSVSMNLARALAENSRTILIDADLRKPSIGKAMGLKPRAVGLSHFLANFNELRDCIYKEDSGLFSYIPSGIIPPNPLDLLSSHKFKYLLKHLIENYDYVVIDSPPLTVSDSLLLSANASGLILVVRSEQTKYQHAQYALKQLKSAKAPLMGIILNDVGSKFVNYKAYRYGT